MESEKEQAIAPGMYTSEQIENLEVELESYKENLELEVSKYTQLEQEFNSLNDSLKGMTEENLGFQAREKDHEQQLREVEEEMTNNFQASCRTLFGEIMQICFNCKSPAQAVSCYKRVKEVMEGKGKKLCSDQPFDFQVFRENIVQEKPKENSVKAEAVMETGNSGKTWQQNSAPVESESQKREKDTLKII
jgi:hypothetical protein